MNQLSRDNSEAGGTFTRQVSEVSTQPKFEIQAPDLVVSTSIVEQDFDPWTMNESPNVDFGNTFYLNNPDHFSRQVNQIAQPKNQSENVVGSNPFNDAEESEFSNQVAPQPQVQLTEFGRNS